MPPPPPPPILAAFTPWDGLVVLAYFALMFVIGHGVSRRKTDARGYFLAQRAMPMWAVALSTVATSLSVATFTGAPEESFKGDLTYLTLNLGGFIAVFVVAFVFIPRFYAAGTVTIYGYIDQRFGETSRIAVSCTFLIGRLLASGARLFFAAIPVCLLLFDAPDPHRWQLIVAIAIIGVVGIAYTVAGGIRAVIWTDSMQIVIVMGTLLLSIGLLLHKIPLPAGQIVDLLHQSKLPDGASKLRWLNFSTDPAVNNTLWTALIYATFANVASYGVDHDLAQRMLTARSAWRGGLSLIAAQCISAAVVALFMAVGLLLYIFYRRPDVMGAAAPSDLLLNTAQVYPQFLLHHLSPGLVGLAMAGMFAAAQGSLDSAINAMASSAVADLYWPIRRRMGLSVDTASARSPRLAVLGMGLLLIAFAVWSALRYDPDHDSILPFALGVMAFAYSGMLGVFLTALLTRRGNTASVLAALITGVVVTALLQKNVYPVWIKWVTGKPHVLATFWWLPIGTVISFAVCVSGRPRRKSQHDPSAPEAAPPAPIDLATPLSLRSAFAFPLQSRESRRDVLIGAAALLIPVVGWLLNMGHRIAMTHRMQRGQPAWPAWGNPRALLRHGLVTFLGMLEYHAPAIACEAIAWRTRSVPLHVLAAALWLLATFAVPGYMTHYCRTLDPREVFNPFRALRRAAEGGRAYWHAWLIVLAALACSFLGLLAAGVGFLVTSVWFWQVAAFSFATVFSQRFGLARADGVGPAVNPSKGPGPL